VSFSSEAAVSACERSREVEELRLFFVLIIFDQYSNARSLIVAPAEMMSPGCVSWCLRY
jgi:hypothetical protein